MEPIQLKEFDQIKKLATGKSSEKTSSNPHSTPEYLPPPTVLGDVRISYVLDPETKGVRVKTESLFQQKPLCSYMDTPLTEFSEYTFVDFIAQGKLVNIKKNAMAFLKKYSRSGGTGFYFYSETPGSGKTMLSCIIASEITREHNKSSQAISVIDMLRRIRSTYDSDVSEQSIINPMMGADVLVMDEIGAEKRSDFSEEVLYEIIDYRLTRKKTTLFTSNLNIIDLPYHTRLISRIRRMSIPIQMPDIDVRFQLAGERDRKLNEVLKDV